MMNSTLSRIITATVLMLVFFVATSGVKAWLDSQKIVLPEWSVDDLPKTLGMWQGTDQEQDDREFAAAGADKSIARSYSNPARENSFSLYLALYTDPGEGLSHMPPVCYAGNGFKKDGKSGEIFLKDADGNEFPLRISKWLNANGQPVYMAYYYQWDEYFLFDRFDLGVARVKMSGTQIQPAMIKVLLEMDIVDEDKDRQELKRIAQSIYDWTNGIERETAADEASP